MNTDTGLQDVSLPRFAARSWLGVRVTAGTHEHRDVGAVMDSRKGLLRLVSSY